FARQRGARDVADLPVHVDAYVAERVSRHRGHRKNGTTAQQVAKEVRGPIEQMLRIVVPGFKGAGRARQHHPFVEAVPGFFEFLAMDVGCGLRRLGSTCITSAASRPTSAGWPFENCTSCPQPC